MTKPKYIPSSDLPDGCYYKCKQCGKDVNQHCLKSGKKEEGKEVPLNNCGHKDRHVLYVVAYEPKTNRPKKHKIIATEKHLINKEAANWIAEIKEKTASKLIEEDLAKITNGYGLKINPGNTPEIERLLKEMASDILCVYQKHAVKLGGDKDLDEPGYYVGPQGILMPKSVSASSINLKELIKEYKDYKFYNTGVSKLEKKRNISKGQKGAINKCLQIIQDVITGLGKDIDTFTIYDFDEDILFQIQEHIEKHYAESTFDNIHQNLVAFENWINKVKFKKNLPIKIFRLIGRKNPEPGEPDTLSPEEHELILQVPGKYQDHDIKYGFDIAAETGFRNSNYINIKYPQIIEDANGLPGVIKYPDTKNNRRLNRTGKQVQYNYLACTKHLQDVLVNEFDYMKNKKRDIYIIHPELNKTEEERETYFIPKFSEEYNTRARNAGIERHTTFTILRNTVITQYDIFRNHYGKEYESVFHTNPKNDKFYKSKIKEQMVFAGWALFKADKTSSAT